MNLRPFAGVSGRGGGGGASLLREFFPCIPLFTLKENSGT